MRNPIRVITDIKVEISIYYLSTSLPSYTPWGYDYNRLPAPPVHTETERY